jgi:hypothetical protein
VPVYDAYKKLSALFANPGTSAGDGSVNRSQRRLVELFGQIVRSINVVRHKSSLSPDMAPGLKIDRFPDRAIRKANLPVQ